MAEENRQDCATEIEIYIPNSIMNRALAELSLYDCDNSKEFNEQIVYSIYSILMLRGKDPGV
jgi:hypothetical protein